MVLCETVCSFLKLVVLDTPAKSQKFGISLPKRQDSSVYLVAGILVLCKSAAPVAVELRGEWEPVRGCPALLPLMGHQAGSASPLTQRAACPPALLTSATCCWPLCLIVLAFLSAQQVSHSGPSMQALVCTLGKFLPAMEKPENSETDHIPPILMGNLATDFEQN